MKRWIGRLGVVAVAVLAIAGLRLTLFKAEPVPVTVHAVARGRVDETVTNSKAGTVRTRHRATLGPEIGGRVEALPAGRGDRVVAGQILLRLADADLKAQVALRERSLEASVAAEKAACLAAGQAERSWQRLEKLGREDIVSPDRLDEAHSQHEVTAAQCQEAAARVLQARASLDAARVDLSHTVLRAPFDGVVADLDTEVGEWITPSPPGVPIPPVMDILDPNSIYVSAPLDEVDAGRVTHGLPVRVTLDPYPDREFAGTVTRVAPYVQDLEEQNRTFEIEVDLEDHVFASTLLPGTSADVEVILESKEDVLRIPSYALIEGGEVFIVDNDHLVACRVETGLSNWEFTEITGGLEPGDLVVVSLDRVEVQEGARVRVEGEPLP